MSTSYTKNEWGDIFGLSPTELPTELLKSINIEKLMEFISIDHRVPSIISEKLLSGELTTDNVLYLMRNDTSILKKYPNIVFAYNKFLEKNANTINSGYFYNRSRIIVWDMLNTENKKIEVSNWVNEKRSIINPSSVDYNWLYDNCPEVADDLVEKIWKDRFGYHPSCNTKFRHMVTTIPAQKIEDVMSRVFESKNKDFIMESLGNPLLSESRTTKALRIYANRIAVPKVNAKISKSMLETLPPITRLNAMEKLVHNLGILDSISEDEFRVLLFGSVVRYPRRVEVAVKIFKRNRSLKNYEWF